MRIGLNKKYTRFSFTWYENMFDGVLCILDGIVKLLSFGILSSFFTVSFFSYAMGKRVKREKAGK